ncbi:thiamine-phosphate kinase [Nitrospira lenta]|uniref:Thiamine-monophosphate kinase n=1 Tax=Nitrospira lenta TaxID=1436998 RepID=A0A330L727_9BACT|nr:thiamine-phosphate kinase [Nitrospira lenta]SPP65663.1 Thiamine-monophosphate kinase [Nitrospira lenta]
MASRKATQPIHEFPLIRQLQRRYERRSPLVRKGIGDDAAVVSIPAGDWAVLTTDLLTEGIHFDLRTTTPMSIGHRAAMANLSDVAAMGATPRFLLVSLAIPPTLRADDIHALYRGLMSACGQHQVHLIGGDTSASRQGLFLSLTLFGTTPKNRVLFRSGARSGDGIYVTGTLGDSLAGLRLLTNRRPSQQGTALKKKARDFLIDRHRHPTARVQEGLWLNRTQLATAAIDLSDGLSGDLRHVCEESQVGADIALATLPISPACRAYADAHKIDPATLALAGGEDYELLFTVAADDEQKLERQARSRGFLVTKIGRIRPRRFGLQSLASDGTRTPLPITSYRHFTSRMKHSG